ncbi:hypothetical protein ACFL6U_29685 [Planctomycetota bacterium]
MDSAPLRTILWLRWRLSRNQWSRGGQINGVLTLAIVFIGMIAGGIGGFVGMAVGAFAFHDAHPAVLLGIWDALILAFLFFWMMGLLTEIQRAEMIDIRRLMHLPIKLSQLFYLNFVASHVCLSLAMFLPFMLGLSLGLTFGYNWRLLAMGPLVLGFFFMVTAWTYCLRGWLVGLMVNPRRRRTVIAVMTLAVILICQLPNLITQTVARRERRTSSPKTKQIPSVVDANEALSSELATPKPKRIPTGVIWAHRLVPILWVGHSACSLGQGRSAPACWACLGFLSLGAIGLNRAYVATLGFYQGQKKGKHRPRSSPVRKEVDTSRPLLLERNLPCVSTETSALGLAFFKSYLRAPEIKMMLATNAIMLVVFGSMFMVRRSTMPFPLGLQPLGVTIAVSVTFFSLTQLMYNLFGSDRGGFRALMLAPVPRQRILIGKNLSVLPFVLIMGGMLIVLSVGALHLAPIYSLSGLLQLGSAFLLLSTAGNAFSILVPYHIAPGSLKPTKMPALVTTMMILVHMTFPLMIAPLFLAPVMGWIFAKLEWAPAAPINLLISLGGLALAYAGYRFCLPYLGRLLQKREQAILAVVTRAVE